ncbi:VPS10 domain-containing protein [Saccharicrinis fermentans]|uniref:Ycf48-like protein n=1 Tax=Saccharicrinis fermentans DSM 9555 = JCM 21142 TaxID=869213 RepID=W7Y0I2_9BACT|nr:YCF48-related protein [Saccharicrinis fermentans]GAF01462.1 Ycf48-like protein [Saccharicrinis fermentans DSM 9555 = JCM 21142]
MKKYLFFFSALVFIGIGLNYFLFREEFYSVSKLKPTSSLVILERQVNRKIERRKRGYAKPDKPDHYINYLRSLVSLDGQSAYQEGYKMKALESAMLRRQSLKSSSEKLPWIQRGPGNIGGRTRCVVVDPDDPTKMTWFAGAVSGGIWKTEDGGVSWDIISPDIPNLATVCLAIAPSNTNVIYAGTGEGYYNVDAVRGDGIFKSTDKGNTWSVIESTSGNNLFYYVNSLVVSHIDENRLWVATNQGVFKSDDGGASWEDSGLDRGDRYQRILIHPFNDAVLWVTRNNKGIYKSEDGGDHWFLVYDMSSLVPERIEIAVAANDPDVLYAMDVNSNFYYSQDGGTEWGKSVENGTVTEFLGSQGWYNNVIAIDPTDATKGFIGGIDLYRFQLGNEIASSGRQAFSVENNMTSWLGFEYFGGRYSNGGVEILEGFQNQLSEIQIQFGPDKVQKAHRLVKKPSEPDFNRNVADDLGSLTYAGYNDVPFRVVDLSTGVQLHVSYVDGNENGSFDIYEGGYEFILIHDVPYAEEAANESVVSNGGAYETMVALYPKLIEGVVWATSGLPEGDLRIRSYELKNRELEASRISKWSAFKSASDYVHADQHNITILEEVGDPFSIVVGNDGGVFYSSDGGDHWAHKSKGYVTSQFYGVTRHPKRYQYFGGLQDNGSALSSVNPNGLSEWEDVLGGDGFDVVWHPRKTTQLMGSYYNNLLQKSVDGGFNWIDTYKMIGDNGDDGSAPFITSIASCLADPDLLFVGGKSGLWKSSDFGDSWKNIQMGTYWGFTSNSSPKVAISEADPDIVWAGVRVNALAGYEIGRVHVSMDGGESFEDIEPFANMGAITDIVTHPLDRETAYLVFSLANRPKIVRTTDLGVTWEDITGFGLNNPRASSSNDFPNVAVNTLLVMPFDSQTLWAGTEIGLFISEDDGVTWTYANNGLPAVSIWDMKIVGDEVIMGTHGLGVWSVKMEPLSNDIKHPFIHNAGINPSGNYVLHTIFDVALDSFELYNDKGLVRTYRTVKAEDRVLTIPSAEGISEKWHIYGYLNGMKYSSNVRHLELTAVSQALVAYTNKFDEDDGLDDFVGSYFSISRGSFSSNAIQSPHLILKIWI